MRIALDAMGGDNAPHEIVMGAVEALKKEADCEVLLVGRQDEIEAVLDAEKPDIDRDRLPILHAEQVIGMDESPVDALRKKRDSSITKALGAVRQGAADAVVSAGNTGAVVGGATLLWKLIPGVRRAGIAVPLGTRGNSSIVIDVGANIHCKPRHLLHYGMMASIYSEHVLGETNPRIALLNIGSEDSKGNTLVKETQQLFEGAPLNFIGHCEGGDIFEKKADVIVCEGFVGNVVLKVSEGLAETMHKQFDEIVGDHVSSHENSGMAEHIQKFRRATDYAEIGGGALLGVNGICIISHGRSGRRAIGNAISLAAKFVRADAPSKIEAGVDALRDE